MKRRDVLIGASVAMVAAPAAALATPNQQRSGLGLQPIEQESVTMRGNAYEKDIFVIRAPGAMSEATSDVLKQKAKEALGDDVIVLVLSDGLTLERIPAIPRRFAE